MKHDPAISIIMPVHNGCKYLKESVDSILNQSFGDFEFIIIDDASSDNSKEIISACKDTRIQLLSNDSHRGISHSLNKAILWARGKYTARMDCDDISLPERLYKQFLYLESHPDISVCGSDTILINENGDQIGTRDTQKTDQQIKIALLLGETSLAHPAVMIRTKYLSPPYKAYSFGYEYAEDYELWCRGSQYMSFANLPVPYVKYRVHTGSVSKTYHMIQRNCARKILRQHLNRLSVPYTPEELACHMQFSLPLEEELTEEFMFSITQWKNKVIRIFEKRSDFDPTVFKAEVEKRYAKIVQRFIENTRRYE